MASESYIFHCLSDFSELDKIETKKATNNDTGEAVIFPIYRCKKCGQCYTVIEAHRDKAVIRLGQNVYINLHQNNDEVRYRKHNYKVQSLKVGTECYVFFQKPEECRTCKDKRLIKQGYTYLTRNGKYNQLTAFECLQCGTKYVRINAYSGSKGYWLPKNVNEIPAMEESSKRESMKKRGFGDIGTQGKLIDAKDFVVRRNVFKCRYKDHHLQNIDAVINIINKKGEITQVKIPAGFCPECNTFFIMESVYQSLKMKGVLICRVSNEKAYLSNNAFMNGMQLAQESVLKQYGYSVAQEEGLSSLTRRKILSLIIDNHILTKNEIIGYLDFFINQRKFQSRFEKAIDKWESDREFVAEYRKGDFKQYGVGGIYRKY